eukprot:GHRQ01009589.1.p1 GENE.GHRQ01009589.1~~GHRQ01009589.1.p1  ORF type:complete len:337 (+),score=43.02 GHRQ01009589.1:699-1709(+)
MPVTVADVLARSPHVVIHDRIIYFTYVAKALNQTLVELGVNCSVAKEVPHNSNATVITFMTHDLGANLTQQYISYNFEQLTTSKQWPQALWDRFKAAQMVWDYSLENIKVLHAHNITHTVHVPLGYASTMDNPEPPAATGRDVDLFFVGVLHGGMCQHRHPILEAVRHASRHKNVSGLQCATQTWGVPAPPNSTDKANTTLPSAVLTESCWDQALQQMHRRTKLALNIHCYPGKTILEVHRVLPLVVDRVLVMSEYSDDPWWDAQYNDIVNFTQGPYLAHNMLEVLKQLQQNSSSLATEAERRYQRLLACCSYNRYVSAALRQQMPSRHVACAGGL